MGKSVLEEVVDERHRQDRKWGGPEHDDDHNPADWADLIQRKAMEVMIPGPGRLASWPETRKVWIEVAALAVAATESLDRKTQGRWAALDG